ncbi:MAG: hypothetical protein AB7O49_03960 [Sphingomonadales bacterium]
MTRPRLHLHVGYPKTGTTTLQRCFFDVLHRHGRIRYLGMFGFEADPTPERRDFFTSLTAALYVEDDLFARALPGLRGRFESLCADAGDLAVVLSNEHFVQSQWSTSVTGQRILPARTADRLSQVFAGADVSLMLAVRRQDALLRSMFLEHASRPHHANPLAYSSLPRYAALCRDRDDFHSDFYDFDRVVSAYRQAFPDAPVLAWTYEAFRDRQADVLSRITVALGLGEDVPAIVPLPLERQNARSNDGGAAVVARWSPLHRALHRLPGGPALATAAQRVPLLAAASNALKARQAVPALDPAEAETVRRLWGPSNARLAALLPALAPDLHAHGYLPEEEARPSALRTA